MEDYFNLNRNVKILSDVKWSGVLNGIERLNRDIQKTLKVTDKKSMVIHLVQENLPAEAYHISFKNSEEMMIGASDELGFIYALNYISEMYLGIHPFWFWNDQTFIEQEEVRVPIQDYFSTPFKVRFRGWFINDEVLIDQWKVEGSSSIPWEMAFEALLRCGGNMVIPGTDINSTKYRGLASGMGLWITHHHAEPLGAQMFARAYPDLNPSYAEHPDLFYQLWEKGIEEQKDSKTIWNLGFRGQGDCPFWATDPQYDTSETRGGLISSIIQMQYDLLCSKVKDPVCCTNLYGETMELYREGMIHFPKEIIKIWADNGYGKMVSRRQDNNNPRVYALPKKNEVDGEHHGLYYHVSFYDLQAANHITMLPNSLEFMNKELQYAFSQGADDFLIVNCSNIKPHVYYLDGIREIWMKGGIDTNKQGKVYVQKYYFDNLLMDENKYLDENKEQLIDEIHQCFETYADCTISFGSHDDEHAGEQFYNYTSRILTSYWLKGEYTKSVKELYWATEDIGFAEQIKWFFMKCSDSKNRFDKLYTRCVTVADQLEDRQRRLFEDSIFLQVKIHLNCLEGSIAFCKSFEMFQEKSYQKSFFLIGNAKEKFQKADTCMRQTEHDKWIGFYKNDCLCDLKQTAYVLRNMMGYIRNIGDGPHFYEWQREFLYLEEDRRVMLLTNIENHLTDEELYDCMKQNNKMLESVQ